MLKMLTPWSLASHQKLGGFVPLLRHWMVLQSGAVEFLRLPWQYEPEFYGDQPGWGSNPPVSPASYAPAFELPEVVAAFDLADLDRASAAGADFELLHTVPLTLVSRPFVFICRGIPELFAPFTTTGAATADGALSTIMPIYEALFASEDCVGVLFLSKSDLEAFARLFPDAAPKLRLLALSAPPAMTAPRPVERPPTLLFTTWPQPDGEGAVLAGVVMAIDALDRLRSHAPDARLIVAVRNGRTTLLNPTAPTVEGRILGQTEVQALIERNLDHIIWLDDRLTEAALGRLLQSSDALLSLGAHADPLTLIMAMSNGCIPVTANSAGAGDWVKHSHTGVLLETLDSDILALNAYGFTETIHTAFYGRHSTLRDRATDAVAPWLSLLADPSARAAFRAGMTARAELRFQHLAGHQQLIEVFGSTSGGEGDLRMSHPVDFDRDFAAVDGSTILTLGRRKIVSAAGGFATAPIEPSVKGADYPRLHRGLPAAVAALLGRETRPADEILRETFAWQPNPCFSPSEPVEQLCEREALDVYDLVHHLQTTPQTFYPEGGYLKPSADGLAVLPNPSPWVYGLYMPLPAELIEGKTWVVVQFGQTTRKFGLALLNAAGSTFNCRVEVPGGKVSAEVWLPVGAPGAASALILHNWDLPLRKEVVLKGLKLVGGPREPSKSEAAAS